MALGDAELVTMLEVLGEPITLGANTTKGIVDRALAPIGPSGDYPEHVSGSVVVQVRTGSLPGLTAGATIIVNGTTFTVREQLRVDDGAITKIDCVALA